MTRCPSISAIPFFNRVFFSNIFTSKWSYYTSGTVQPEAREVNVITSVENSNFLEKKLIKKTSQGFSQLELFTILSFLWPLCWLVAALFSLLFLKGLVKSWKSTILPDSSESVKMCEMFSLYYPYSHGKGVFSFHFFSKEKCVLHTN